MATETLIGVDAKLYYMVGGQSAPGGTWLELTNCQDVTTTLSKKESDVTTRGGGGWEQTKGTLKRCEFKFKMIWDTLDAGFTAIRSAYFNNALIGIKALDKAAGQGPMGDFEVIEFSRSEPTGDALTVDVTLKLGRSDTPLTWVTGG